MCSIQKIPITGLDNGIAGNIMAGHKDPTKDNWKGIDLKELQEIPPTSA